MNGLFFEMSRTVQPLTNAYLVPCIRQGAPASRLEDRPDSTGAPPWLPRKSRTRLCDSV